MDVLQIVKEMCGGSGARRGYLRRMANRVGVDRAYISGLELGQRISSIVSKLNIIA
jgi:hypothetical protein